METETRKPLNEGIVITQWIGNVYVCGEKKKVVRRMIITIQCIKRCHGNISPGAGRFPGRHDSFYLAR